MTRDQERKACDDAAERLLLPLDASRGCPIESVAQVVDICQLSRHAIDEERGHGCRRLEARMGHDVDHRVVAFVADAGDDGQGELCAVGGQGVGVEAAEVGRGATAADDDDDVEGLADGIDAIQRGDDARLRSLALHEGGVEPDVEREAILVAEQLVGEVLVARGRGGRDDGDALWPCWERQGAVEVEDTVGLQLPDDLLAPSHQVAHRERGVDVVDGQGEAVQLVKVDGHAHEHLQPRREGSAGLLLEVRADDGVLLGPDRAACSGCHLPGAFVLFDKLQIAVARIAIHAHLARLGPHPIRLGQGVAEGLLDVAVQLRE